MGGHGLDKFDSLKGKGGIAVDTVMNPRVPESVGNF
jgi:hypothetical protein